MLALQLACGGWIASAVGAVARLGVPDLLANGPRSTAELAQATATAEPVLARVLGLLAALGLLERQEDGRYANTSESELLRTNHPRSVRSFCMLASGEYQRVFHELDYSLKTGASASAQAFGGSIYDYMESRPQVADVYDAAMEDLARPVGHLLAGSLSLADTSRVVDVGGGRGTILQALLSAHQHLEGVCVDRPDVCARAEAHLADTRPDLASRLRFQEGDFFREVPRGADVYILKNVLHNWSDASAVEILRRVHEAMEGTPGARLVVVEPLLGPGSPSVYQAMDDLLQVVLCEDDTTARTREQMTSLLSQASLKLVQARALPTGHDIVEAVCRQAG